MQISQTTFGAIGRISALAVFATVATVSLYAQQVPSAEGSNGSTAVEASSSTLLAANTGGDGSGYSSSVGAPETDAAVNFLGGTGVNAAMQPPPRRYGRRPIYADSAHNADGSNKYTFFGGAGFTLPVGGSHGYLSPSYSFQAGGGRNFNKTLAMLVEFDWANFDFNDATKAYLTGEYQTLCQANCTGTALTSVSGHSHDWSFTVGPQVYVAQGEKTGVYVIGGVGFYHKIADITTPGIGTYCDPYYGCVEYQADETIDKYTSNSLGVNGGIGFTYKPSRFGNEKFYAEARYVFTDNQPKPFYDGSSANPTSNPNYFNAFPQNSARTTYIPVNFGVRF